ncbi:MAG: translation initiation factor IF-1 [Verrucomicrobiota bacterium]|nr:translation initiation factor IF-1 [Verrucomicrobiota bacterium]
MVRENTIEVEGAIVEALPNKTYCVELANGHRLRAYVAGKAKFSLAQFAPGEKVRLALSPYDLSVGRILV